MKLKVVIFVFIMGSAFLAVLFYHYSNNEKERDENRKETSHKISKKSTPRPEKIMLGRKTISQLYSSSHITEDGEESEGEEHELDPKLKEYYMSAEWREILSKTDPVYFQKAPIILEEMWSEEAHDEQWTKSCRTKMSELEDELSDIDAEIQNIDCGTQICKVDILLENEDNLELFKTLLFKNRPPYGDDYGKVSWLENGDIKITVYFSKENDGNSFTEMRKRMYKDMFN